MVVNPIVLPDLRAKGLYTRPTSHVDGRLWDAVSGAPMATEFAISRFFLPLIAGCQGWALFADCDVLARRDVADLFALADDRYAVMCVKHPPSFATGEKMDGQAQLAYPRKNWSSVMLWNLAHPSHHFLTTSTLNRTPGRDLHAFCWLKDEEIGALPPEWNWLEGVSPPLADPAIVHLTRGGPWFPEWQGVEYAEAWFAELGRLTLSRKGVPL